MSTLNLKPTFASVKAYYATLQKFALGNFDNEGNIRGVFEDLLKTCARQFDWTLVPEYEQSRKGKHPIRIDGAILDAFNLPRGFWEAKDIHDDLEVEMKKKFEAGYPRTNILFQKPDRALLFQDGRIAFHDSITNPQDLIDVLRLFFEWRQPYQEDWDRAVQEFSEHIPRIAEGAMKIIAAERETNREFVERFKTFAELCRESINPDLKDEAVEEMLVQHLLTERIFRRIFSNSEFTRRNVIAAEIEKVIDSLTSRQFSRDAFLSGLDRFYKAIEEAASTTESYTEKQAFLNKVYERFFQGFSKKQADTHGIVYTPQSIVDFMVRSVEQILKSDFGRSFSDRDVHILDPFVGTGNFITRVMQEIKASRLPEKYREELHCNEIMLLPYYIASMNIEHAYLDRTGEYAPFEGICLVDTFQNTGQASFFTTENTTRIRRQMAAPIRVVIGNPPYNMGQQNESDQNKNRRYTAAGAVDDRVAKTYTRDSSATLRNKLGDPYVKAFRWATDRIQNHGIVCLISNNSFIDQIAFDGMRSHLERDFSTIYLIDLGGNVRKNPKLSGTTHNVFGIQVGVTITLLIRHVGNDTNMPAKIHYARMNEDWRRGQKCLQLESWKDLTSISWTELVPDARHTWLTGDQKPEFEGFLPIGSKKSKGDPESQSLFTSFSLGLVSSRDAFVYNHDKARLAKTMRTCVRVYREALGLMPADWKEEDGLNGIVDPEDRRIKWSRQVLNSLKCHESTQFSEGYIRSCNYRPFLSIFHYFDDFWNEERYQLPLLFVHENEPNPSICLNQAPDHAGFWCLGSSRYVDFHFTGDSQCFPYYTYDQDGSNRRENITDWALNKFRTHYGQQSITKRDIFHYTYGLLHHPDYQTHFAANLKRELPRIPFAPDFHPYADIGAGLMTLHIDYEKQPEYSLERAETGQLDWRVVKMSLSKDKTQLKYNEFLTLSGIPPEVFEYRLGNRSALEWVIDQYRVSTDTRSGIVNDPNRPDDPEYIARLIGQVVTVSLGTVARVRSLATVPLLETSPA